MRSFRLEYSEYVPEQRKRLGYLEKAILLDALAFQASVDSHGGKKDFVVDISMALPSGYTLQLINALSAMAPAWPKCGKQGALEDPMELVDTQTEQSDEGLWSLLPTRLYRKVTRHGKSPDHLLIDIASQVLHFGDACSGMFAFSVKDVWPDVPPLRFFIASTHFLFASQRFESEESGRRWLSLAQNTFNTPTFAREMGELDKEMGLVEEAPDFILLTRVEERYCGWLPSEGLHTKAILTRVANLNSSGIQNADRAVAKSLASLRDRGFVTLQGNFESPHTNWLLPERCVLTGTGYLRAKALART